MNWFKFRSLFKCLLNLSEEMLCYEYKNFNNNRVEGNL